MLDMKACKILQFFVGDVDIEVPREKYKFVGE
jgi:hypothetical protein